VTQRLAFRSIDSGTTKNVWYGYNL